MSRVLIQSALPYTMSEYFNTFHVSQSKNLISKSFQPIELGTIALKTSLNLLAQASSYG